MSRFKSKVKRQKPEPEKPQQIEDIQKKSNVEL